MISEFNNHDRCQDCTNDDELVWVRSDKWHYQYKSYFESSFQRRGEAWRKEWRLTFREEYKGGRARVTISEQWLKCNGTRGNAVPPPPVSGSKRFPTSNCYNAWKRHTTTDRGPKPECSVPPPLILHFNHWHRGMSAVMRLR